ncbi:ferrochelatase [Uliginosibacterium sp. H1]|uniref:ferrochelatase n=1 Tax=Uliginosibacterium sp. H1 TaxID=3114757 RepID=UPI002E175BA2|nr:ferrochelatase [Uliginosibacterium sp. H1]
MSRFLPEPAHRHGSTERFGILLVNLGTPEAATAPAVKKYLAEFLADPRVVEIPSFAWKPVLHGIILNTRPKKSAAKYAQVWTSEGSPLAVHTERQAKLLQGYFGHAGEQRVCVMHAMRYGQPAIADVIGKLKEEQCSRILVLPMYPQYAASTTASVMDAVGAALARIRNLPEIRLVRSFHDDPGYIRALAASVQEHWARNGRGEKLVMSFHGLPRFSLDRGDPYHCECHKTARLLAEALGLKADGHVVTFQSRFGRAEWLQPYTQATLEKMAGKVKTVDVICPGFVADCLETLEEIAMECKAAFLNKGGRELRYIPALNERHEFVAALHAIARRQMGDWLARPQPSAEELRNTETRAKTLGASR